MEFEPKAVFGHWCNQTQPLTLGSLLTVRKELELLATGPERKEIRLFFSASEKEVLEKAPYAREALNSSFSFKLEFERAKTKGAWPFEFFGIDEHSFDSMKRVSLLAQILGVFPALQWPEAILEKTRFFYLSLEKKAPHVVAIHLKRQKGGASESNAHLSSWADFFSKERSSFFLLLGKDPLDEKIAALPNVLYTQTLCMPLAEELCLIQMADAFLGMSSGLCVGAMFSKTPYVIFKHPLHHKELMQDEIGAEKRFSFALPGQEIWREMDTLANLQRALKTVFPLQNTRSVSHVC